MRERDRYGGLVASTWDLLRGDTSDWPDVPFYREVIDRAGQPVLDVGCATGRLLLDFLAAGVDIDGVDSSEDMLAICRDKAASRGLRPRLYEQRMEQLDLPRRYRTILVPSSSFQLVIDRDLAVQAMRRFHAHLDEGGVLAMPFMILEGAETPWRITAERVRPEDGAQVRRWSMSSVDLDDQLERDEDRIEILRDGSLIAAEERTQLVRWYTRSQAEALYLQAHFQDVQVLDGFTFKTAASDARLFTVLGRR